MTYSKILQCKLRLILAFGLMIVFSGVNLFAQDDDGYKTLFNGKDLTGWKVSENPDSIVVEDGAIAIKGKRAHAFYVGEDGDASFKNFHFKAKVKTAENANSGIYFHTEYQQEGWPTKGYECQVNNTHKDPKKTGGLYAVQDNFEAPVKDGEWFDYDIIVKDKHIVLKINGETISDYTEPENPQREEKMAGRLLDQGTFAIQAHDPLSYAWFKDIKVKTLP